MKNTFNHNQTTSMLNCYPSRDNGKNPRCRSASGNPWISYFQTLGSLFSSQFDIQF
jgi:hypothetical protein